MMTLTLPRSQKIVPVSVYWPDSPNLTEQRKHFVEAYCRLGNGTLAAKEAGYKDSPSLVNQASKLKSMWGIAWGIKMQTSVYKTEKSFKVLI